MQFNRIKYDYTTSKIKSNRVKINYLKLLLALCILALTLCAGWPDEAKCDEKVLIFVLCILEMICLSIHNKTKYFVLLISRFVGKKNFRFWTFCNLFSEKNYQKIFQKTKKVGPLEIDTIYQPSSLMIEQTFWKYPKRQNFHLFNKNV